MPFTSDESAFLVAIRAAPADDAPRLVYADWLDEHGHAERAEFIRVQVELARWKDVKLSRASTRRLDALRRQQRELLKDCDWFSVGSVHVRPVVGHQPIHRRQVDQAEAVGEVARGFLEWLYVEGEDWVRLGDALTAAHSLMRDVTVTTWPLVVTGRDLYEKENYRWMCVPKWQDGKDLMKRFAADATHEELLAWILSLWKERWHGIQFNLPQSCGWLIPQGR